MKKYILCAICALSLHTSAHSQTFEFSPNEAVQLINKPWQSVKNNLLIKKYIYKSHVENTHDYFRGTYKVTLVVMAEKVTHLSTQEFAADYEKLVRVLKEEGFVFNIAKSSDFVQTGWDETIHNGKYQRTPTGIPPSKEFPAMALRFDKKPYYSCFLIAPYNLYQTNKDNKISVVYSPYSSK